MSMPTLYLVPEGDDDPIVPTVADCATVARRKYQWTNENTFYLHEHDFRKAPVNGYAPT